jgi:hypothetical protein
MNAARLLLSLAAPLRRTLVALGQLEIPGFGPEQGDPLHRSPEQLERFRRYQSALAEVARLPHGAPTGPDAEVAAQRRAA